MRQIRKLARSEIEAADPAMPEIMRFHDRLLGVRLHHASRVPAEWARPEHTDLMFEEDSALFRLLGVRLHPTRRETEEGGHPASTVLLFEDGSALFRQFDNRGRPGDTAWVILSETGGPLRGVSLLDLRERPVVSVGYFHLPGAEHPVIPHVEMEGGAHIACTCSRGGAVMLHHRGDGSWSLLRQFTRTAPE